MPAAHRLIQDTRRNQPAGQTVTGRAGTWCGRLLLRQPCAGRGSGGAGDGHRRGDRDAVRRARREREGVLADGARIVAYDRFTESREAIAADISAREGRVVVPSYDDADIIAGQGTAGLEIAQQAAALGASVDHLVCCVGGGGLIAGVGLAMAALSPRTRVWGAEPEGFDDHAVSLARGEVTPHDGKARSICDALLSPAPGEMTFALNRRQLSGVMVVSDDQVRSAMRAAFRHLKLVVEPGGAAALAAVMHQAPRDWAGQTVAVLLTGGNVDPAQFAEVISSSR